LKLERGVRSLPDVSNKKRQGDTKTIVHDSSNFWGDEKLQSLNELMGSEGESSLKSLKSVVVIQNAGRVGAC
jgi:hypothetical protein